MTNIVQFPAKAIPAPATIEPQRAPYSFDILQTEKSDMVLIDACVPADIAIELLKMLEARFPSAA
jgi:hypothetical protein